jgi:hypothetical protein
MRNEDERSRFARGLFWVALLGVALAVGLATGSGLLGVVAGVVAAILTLALLPLSGNAGTGG